MNHKIVLSGYYGFSNAGDEAMLYSIIRSLQITFQNPEITVISGNPKATKEEFEVKTISRFDGIKILRAIWNTDILISGGGSLLQDVTSGKSILYYMLIILLGVIFRKKVFLFAQGIGPVRYRVTRVVLKHVLNHVDFITVRDKESKGFLTRLGVKEPIYHTADAVMLLPSVSLVEGRKILQEQKIPLDKKLIGISVRKWKELDKWKKEFRVFINKLLEQEDVVIVFITMQRPGDTIAARKIIKADNKRIFLLKGNYKVDELMSIIGNIDVLVGMRLHALIFASLMHVRVVGISYDPKVNHFLDSINEECLCNVSSLDAEKLYHKTYQLLEESTEEHDWSAVENLRHCSQKTIELLKQMINNREK